MRERVDADLPVVDAEAEAGDRALGLEARERRHGAVHRLAKALRLRVAVRVARDVVNEHVVDPREAEPLQAVVDAAQRPVVRVVPALDERQHVDVAVLVARRARDPATAAGRPWSTAGSRRAAASRNAAPIRCSDKPVAVMRRRVEIADAAIERVADERVAASSSRSRANRLPSGAPPKPERSLACMPAHGR